MGVTGALRITLVFFAIALLGCSPAEPLEETIDQTYAIDRNSSLDITNVDGTIQIYGAHKPGLHLHAVKKAYRAARLKAIQVNVVQTAEQTTITTTFPRSRKWSLADRSGTVDYVLILPSSCPISRARVTNGEVTVAGMDDAPVNTAVQNGRIFIKNCFRNVQAKAATGNIAIGYDWWWNTKFTAVAQMTDGNVFASIPSDASFRMHAVAPNGKIGNDFAEQEERTRAAVTKVDSVVGTNPQAAFDFSVDDGNIKIMEVNP